MRFGDGIWGKALSAVLAFLVACGPAAAQSAFFREVVVKPRAMQADGLRVVSILLGNRVGNLQSDTEFLRARGVLPGDWKPGADLVLSKGYMAYLLVKALDVHGGAGARLFGFNKRRAFQELVYLQIMPGKGGEHAKLTGAELITLLDRATAHRDRHRASPPEPGATAGEKPGRSKP